jgi:hypothetical protein
MELYAQVYDLRTNSLRSRPRGAQNSETVSE